MGTFRHRLFILVGGCVGGPGRAVQVCFTRVADYYRSWQGRVTCLGGRGRDACCFMCIWMQPNRVGPVYQCAMPPSGRSAGPCRPLLPSPLPPLAQGPVISAYAAANGMLPLPFKDRIEEALDRRAIWWGEGGCWASGVVLPKAHAGSTLDAGRAALRVSRAGSVQLVMHQKRDGGCLRLALRKQRGRLGCTAGCSSAVLVFRAV